jgi:hypothetical protein
MSFTDYNGLKAEIQSFLWDRTDVVAKIPSFITLAEAEMKRELRTQQVVQNEPFTVSSEVASIPCGSRQIMSIKLNFANTQGTFDLDYATPEQASQWNFVSPARPRFYTIEGGLIRLYPTPDYDYTGTVVYRDTFCPLSNTNRTNWVLERHPDIYLCGALKWAKAWLIDSDQDWAGPFYSAIEAANRDQPMRQANTRLRADDATIMNGRGGRYWIYSDSFGGVY